jgi:hypothetical protein
MVKVMQARFQGGFPLDALNHCIVNNSCRTECACT